MLTEDEKAALRAVEDGADVYSYALARTLRIIDQRRPGLVDICDPQAYHGDGTDQVPYFGAILTDAGKAALNEEAI